MNTSLDLLDKIQHTQATYFMIEQAAFRNPSSKSLAFTARSLFLRLEDLQKSLSISVIKDLIELEELKDRVTQSVEDFKHLMESLGPYIKQPEIKEISTTGTWQTPSIGVTIGGTAPPP